jgi:hypothetical protein
MKFKLLFLITIMVLPTISRGQSSLYELNGFIESLTSAAKYPLFNDRLFDQEFHGRLNSQWYPSYSLRGEADLRARFFYGESVEKIPNFLDQIKVKYPFVNLDAVLWDQKKTIGYLQIDRFWLDYTSGSLELTAGRQRIAWGTALVWNVIDLFNPKSVLDFDYEEKPGSDAFRFQYYTGAVSKVEAAAMPNKTFKGSTVAGLCSYNKFGCDFYAIGGMKNDRWVAGGAWAGSILKAGFRGEFLVSESPSADNNPSATAGAFWSDNPYLGAVLSADYTFPSSFYIHTEVLYYSNGKKTNAGLYQIASLEADMLSPARWSIYQEFSGDLNPLTKATVFAIFNPDDESSIIVPMLTKSVSTNLDLLVIGLFATGNPNTEYHSYGTSAYIRLKYSF